jgi:hypothetical protein
MFILLSLAFLIIHEAVNILVINIQGLKQNVHLGVFIFFPGVGKKSENKVKNE